MHNNEHKITKYLLQRKFWINNGPDRDAQTNKASYNPK